MLCDADPVQIKAMRASKSAAALILGGSKPELLGASVFGGLCNYKVASSSCGFKIFSNTEPFVFFSTNHFGSLLSRSVLRPISLAAVSPFILQKYVVKKTGVHGDQERGRPITYSCKIHDSHDEHLTSNDSCALNHSFSKHLDLSQSEGWHQ